MIGFLGDPIFRGGYSSALGKLYTYEPGTTTNKAVYPTIADAIAETNALSNPVVLDSLGEATIVLKGTYRLVLDDSSDVELWDEDNVSTAYTPCVEELRFHNTNRYIGLNSPDSLASSISYILPTADGSSGDLLKTDGSLGLGFVVPPSEVSDDTTPQLGGNLGTNGFDILVDSTKGILDSSSNEQTLFTETASAVNYLNITNAVTATGPTLAAAGSDSNIDFNIDSKGTGNVSISANSLQVDNGATGPGEIRLLEDSDNGTNYMGLKAPSSVTSSTTMILPDGPGTANYWVMTDGVDTLDYVEQSRWTRIKLSSDLVYTNTTPAAVSELTFTPEINSTYEIRVKLLVVQAGPVSAKHIGISWNSGTNDGAVFLRGTNRTNQDYEGYYPYGTDGSTSGGLYNLDDGVNRLKAILVTGADASGDVSVTVSQYPAGVTTVRAGSFLEYRKI